MTNRPHPEPSASVAPSVLESWANDQAVLELLGRRVIAAMAGDLPVPPGGYDLCGSWLAQAWFSGGHPLDHLDNAGKPS